MKLVASLSGLVLIFALMLAAVRADDDEPAVPDSGEQATEEESKEDGDDAAEEGEDEELLFDSEEDFSKDRAEEEAADEAEDNSEEEAEDEKDEDASEDDDESTDESAEEEAEESDDEKEGDEEESEDTEDEDEKSDEDEKEEGEEETEAPAEAEVKTILSGLDNPASVVVQTETGHVFVSDSGASRVVSFNPSDREAVKAVITGFPKDVYGKGPMYNIGPLGLAFLDKNTLVVGGGELKDGEEVVRIFDVSSGAAMTFEDTKHKLGPIGPGDESEKGEGNFYAVAASKTAIYATSNGDDTKGWVLKIDLDHGKPGELKTFIATKVALEDTDAPVGITLNRDGQIVVGQMGEINKPSDSLYTVYDPETGELMARAETGLHDIAGLAFSPSGKLYAVDFAWMDATQGGLFRLDITEDTVQSVKIASLDKPTALCFSPDGELYVTVIGTAEEGSDKKPGKLVKVMGEF